MLFETLCSQERSPDCQDLESLKQVLDRSLVTDPDGGPSSVFELIDISGVSICVSVGHPSSRLSQVLISMSTRRSKLSPEIQSADLTTNLSFDVRALYIEGSKIY